MSQNGRDSAPKSSLYPHQRYLDPHHNSDISFSGVLIDQLPGNSKHIRNTEREATNRLAQRQQIEAAAKKPQLHNNNGDLSSFLINFISSGITRGSLQLFAEPKEEGEGRSKEELTPSHPHHHEAPAQHGQRQGKEKDERPQRRL